MPSLSWEEFLEKVSPTQRPAGRPPSPTTTTTDVGRRRGEPDSSGWGGGRETLGKKRDFPVVPGWPFCSKECSLTPASAKASSDVWPVLRSLTWELSVAEVRALGRTICRDCGCNCRSRSVATLLLRQSAVVCRVKSRNGRRPNENIDSSPKTQNLIETSKQQPSQRILTDVPSTWGGASDWGRNLAGLEYTPGCHGNICIFSRGGESD